MNDLLAIYLQPSPPLTKYMFGTFLFNEIAPKKKGTVEDVRFAVNDILLGVGFDVHLLGFGFLREAALMRITDDNISEVAVMKKLSNANSMPVKYIRACILSLIGRNKRFTGILRRIFPKEIIPLEPNISQTLSLIYTLYKKFYNYIVPKKAAGDGHTEV